MPRESIAAQPLGCNPTRGMGREAPKLARLREHTVASACYNFFGNNSYSGLTEVVIPDSVTQLCESAFEGCYDLESVTMSDSITKIERRTFYQCSKLNDIEVGRAVEEIESNAFSDCRSLQCIFLPASVKK